MAVLPPFPMQSSINHFVQINNFRPARNGYAKTVASRWAKTSLTVADLFRHIRFDCVERARDVHQEQIDLDNYISVYICIIT